jgi:AmmeMemoRadiSam system protein B/AmmeMemoRadiSam system protein A
MAARVSGIVLWAAAVLAAVCTGCGPERARGPAAGSGADTVAPRTAEEETTMNTNVMVSPLAGRWFSASAAELRREIAELMPSPRPSAVAGVCAVLVPHAGYVYSGRVALEVYARLDPQAYDRVVVLGPSHSMGMRDRVSVPDASAIETPLGRVPVDTAFVAAMRRLPMVISEPRAHAREHSDQIQVPLLQSVLGNRVPVVTVVVGQFSADSQRAFAESLRPLLDDRTLVVVSSDFTHYGPDYGYVPFTNNVAEKLPALDDQVFARIAARDSDGFHRVLEETGATVCGAMPIGILLALLPPGATARKVAADHSGRMLGDWRNSVGYVGAIFQGKWGRAPAPAAQTAAKTTPKAEAKEEAKAPMLGETDRKALLRLARASLDRSVRGRPLPTPEEAGIAITPALEQVMGGFVTLTKAGHELRGCIGEIFPKRAIWKVVREQARNAALEDGRFEPVTAEEAPGLHIEISALTPPRPVASYRDIVTGRHGMVLVKSGRSAVFLPQVAPEQGWDLATTLTHLAMKAGLQPDAWREGADFLVFEAEVFHE